jgi:hypothetical protein
LIGFIPFHLGERSEGTKELDCKERIVPSLKSLCEKVAAECIVEPRNAIQLLEIADSLGAEDLKKYCEVMQTFPM